jgi:hypothetical protein
VNEKFKRIIELIGDSPLYELDVSFEVDRDLIVRALLKNTHRDVFDSQVDNKELGSNVEEIFQQAWEGIVMATSRVNYIESGVLKIPLFENMPVYSHWDDRVVICGRSYECEDVLSWLFDYGNKYYNFEVRSKDSEDQRFRLTDLDKRDFILWGDGNLTGLIQITPIKRLTDMI